MSRIKGSDVASFRSLLRQKPPGTEARFLDSLPPALRQLYLETSPVTWNPVEAQAQLYELGAAFLFSGTPEPVVELLRVLARTSYSSLYKVFLRIPTVKFVAERAARVWGNYYDTGSASVENATKTSFDFVVKEFPDLPRALREATTGHILAILDLTGTREAKVTSPSSTPDAWVWHATWSWSNPD